MVKNDLALIVISLVILGLDIVNWTKPFKIIADSFVKPVKQNVYSAGSVITNLPYIAVSYSQAQKLSTDLKTQSQKNQELNLKVDLLTLENQKLREQLNAALPRTYRYIAASVVGLSRYLELSAGENDGVKTGMAVVSGQAMVGKIITVSQNRSLVMLLTDLEISVPARTLRGTRGTVVGAAGSNIIINKVLQKEQLFLDDTVVTSGEDNYPPNLLIGKVVHIVSSDVEVYKEAKIAPAVEFNREQTVFIIAGQ